MDDGRNGLVNCILRGVRVIDPAAGLDVAGQDVWLSEGRIIAIYREIGAGTVPVIDLTPLPGESPCILTPGFIDLHAHLREPGDEAAETVQSGAVAAAAGGFTTVVAMANTDPPVDTPGRVAAAVQRGAGAAVQVVPVAAVTTGLAGETLVDVDGCAAAGAAGFSDDGRNLARRDLLAEAIRRAHRVDRVVMVHPEDEAIIAAHNGRASTPNRSPDRPEEAETAAVRTALEALSQAGCGRLHLQHISTAAAVDLLRQARNDGLAVTAEATPHHLSMWTPTAGSALPPALLKVNPPLRRERDRNALIAGVREGVIDAIATDHAPHREENKMGDPVHAAAGMTGLETALAVCITLGGFGGDWIPVLLERLTAGAHRVLGAGVGVRAPRLRVGELATCVLFDPAATWTVGETTRSLSTNTPFRGQRLHGRVLLTLAEGRVAHRDVDRIPVATELAGAANA